MLSNTKTKQSSFSIIRSLKTNCFYVFSNTRAIQPSFSTIRHPKTHGFHMFSNTKTIQSSFSIIRPQKSNGSHMFSNKKAIQSSFSTIRPPRASGFHVFEQNSNTVKLFYYSTSQNHRSLRCPTVVQRFTSYRIPSKPEYIVQNRFPLQIFTNCNLNRRPQMRSHSCETSAPGVHSRYLPSPLSRAVAGQAR